MNTAWYTGILSALFAILLTSFPINISFAQDTFTDPRDGHTYTVVTVGDQSWFGENLKYKTPTSWCAKAPESEACTDGNFYYYTDLDSVCPSGWRVPHWEDYRMAISSIGKIRKDSLVWIHGTMPNKTIEATTVEGLQLTDRSEPLQIIATGWIQGNKWFDQKNTTTLWIANKPPTDKPQPHLHIRENAIVRHAHAHNVLDKPKRQRRFSVRCVSGTMPANGYGN